MPLTQYEVDQNRQTARQAALNNLMGGLQSLEQNAKTKRAEALQNQQTAFEFKKAGYDVSPEMVAQNKADEPSGFAKFFGAKSPERPDLFANRTQEYKTQLAQAADDRAFKRKTDTADMNYKISQAAKDNQYKDAQMASMGVENQKKLAETQKLQSESKNGKQMSAADIAKFDEGNQIPSMLQDIKGTLGANKDSFGPYQGRVSTLNPWNEKAQTIESQFRTASQSFGRFMEGGVLRKEDEEKYRKMFPNQSDTPAVASNKLANVERLLAQKQSSTIGALKGAGYDVSSIDKNLSIPDAPEILAGKKDKVVNSANAADPEALKQHLKTVSREEKIRMLQGK